MAELGTIINPDLFKSTTDGISGTNLVKVVDGEFEYVPEPVQAGATFGEMSIQENSVSLSLTEVTNPSDDSNYVKLNNNLWSSNSLEGVTFNDGYLEIQTPGVYQLSFWGTFSVTSSSNTDVYFDFSTDDTNTTLSGRRVSRTSDFSGDRENISASGIVQSLSAGDKISLWVAATEDCQMTMHQSGFHLILIKG